ncbi:hypothetical protein FRC07_008382, partial [Ceratobasidium sp. 392]
MPSIRGKYAQSILTAHHDSIKHIPPLVKPVRSDGEVVKIGILGAGAAGLYLALMIDYLKGLSAEKGFEFNYDYVLHEANPSKTHIGGRIYTHRFPSPQGGVPLPYDYYDVGAMRFPNLPWMRPTFGLISYLDIDMIEYIMKDGNGNNINSFNGVTKMNRDLHYSPQNDYDPFGTGLSGLTGSPDEMAKAKIGSFMSGLVADWATGWNTMMSSDEWSTRGYMTLSSQATYSDDVVSYLETFNSSTGLYDCALTESVMDALDFDYTPPQLPPPPPTKQPYNPPPLWYCINGGTDQIITKALSKISNQPKRGDRAIAIAPVCVLEEADPVVTAMTVTIMNNGAVEQHQYHHVVSTMPLSCLSQVDTSQCHFSWNLRTAIRDLHYDCSTKVAIQFSERWWETLVPPKNGPQIGGISSTDRPTRTVVYPSYGIRSSGQGATMIVSYTWAQDAFRLGSLAQGKGSNAETALIAGILKDLTDMHNIAEPNYLRGLMLNYHVFDWYGHESSMGKLAYINACAFALFGPGQFKNLYPLVTKPVYGRLHFAGEATSVHHAWIVGALNSAYRSLFEILELEGQKDLITQYINASGSPFQYAGTDEVVQEKVNRQ